jgi:ribonuclease R
MNTANSSRTVTGRIDVHPRGFGFLLVDAPDSEGVRSAFIPPPELHTFLADDFVRARVVASADGRWSASEFSLLQRPREQVYGEVTLRQDAPHLRIDRQVANGEWPLDASGTELKSGDAVVARVADGKAVLLRKLDPGADRSLERILTFHGLRRDRRYADLSVHRTLKQYLRGRRDFVHEDPAPRARTSAGDYSTPPPPPPRAGGDTCTHTP